MNQAKQISDKCNKKRNRRRAFFFLSLLPLAQTMGFAMLVLLNLSIFGMTFASANKLKGWTFVIIGCHLAILATVAGSIHHKKVKREFRAVVDDETYYECYPRDYGRMLKRKERERRRLERQQARYPINE